MNGLSTNMNHFFSWEVSCDDVDDFFHPKLGLFLLTEQQNSNFSYIVLFRKKCRYRSLVMYLFLIGTCQAHI